MIVRILKPAMCACFGKHDSVAPGDVVETIPASNLPDCEAKGLLWVDSDPDCYGILLEAGDYETGAKR